VIGAARRESLMVTVPPLYLESIDYERGDIHV
jgi:hypothetical protein